MSHTDFPKKYEAALASQDWNKIAPLIHPQACVTFSNGIVHVGKAAIQTAYEKNFELIQSENFSIKNIHWLPPMTESAVYLFEYEWRGIVRGKPVAGQGCGTAVLVEAEGHWQLIAEHLGQGSA